MPLKNLFQQLASLEVSFFPWSFFSNLILASQNSKNNAKNQISKHFQKNLKILSYAGKFFLSTVVNHGLSNELCTTLPQGSRAPHVPCRVATGFRQIAYTQRHLLVHHVEHTICSNDNKARARAQHTCSLQSLLSSEGCAARHPQGGASTPSFFGAHPNSARLTQQTVMEQQIKRRSAEHQHVQIHRVHRKYQD